MALRVLLVAILLASGRPAAAASCGSLIDRSQLDSLAGALLRGAGSLAEQAQAQRREAVDYALRDAAVLRERVERAAILAEIRDAMRHEGERSFVQFKLSQEAALLKEASAGMLEHAGRLLGPDDAGSAAAAYLLDALRRTASVFGPCDSPG